MEYGRSSPPWRWWCSCSASFPGDHDNDNHGDTESERGGGGMFHSPVVNAEGNRLMRDHEELARLGAKYKSFDRDGKLAYIEQMASIFERWRVFLKRFELSDDFQAQMYVKQLDAWLAQFGMDRHALMRNMETSMSMMRQEAQREP